MSTHTTKTLAVHMEQKKCQHTHPIKFFWYIHITLALLENIQNELSST